MSEVVRRVCECCGTSFFAEGHRVRQGLARFCSVPCGLTLAREERWRRYASTEEERLNAMRITRGDDECWGWAGFTYKGYGRISRAPEHGGRAIGAHRLAYEIAYGPIPAGLTVLHRCDNPECTNPRHLFLGTNQDNNRDRDTKGRQAKGERQGSAKLTEADVRAIRASAETFDVLAARYSVSPATIAQAARGATWSHVPGAKRRRRVRRDAGQRRSA